MATNELEEPETVALARVVGRLRDMGANELADDLAYVQRQLFARERKAVAAELRDQARQLRDVYGRRDMLPRGEGALRAADRLDRRADTINGGAS